MRTVCMEIPTDVLRDAGATIPPEWADLDTIEVELHYIPELNWADDVPFFEGTVDGTWKDDFDANKLPDDLLEKAREKWMASR